MQAALHPAEAWLPDYGGASSGTGRPLFSFGLRSLAATCRAPLGLLCSTRLFDFCKHFRSGKSTDSSCGSKSARSPGARPDRMRVGVKEDLPRAADLSARRLSFAYCCQLTSSSSSLGDCCASGCVSRKCRSTMRSSLACSLSPRLSASWMSSRIMSRIFSAPCGALSK